MTDACSVARYIIRHNHSGPTKEKLTSIKMQNLLYYCFGSHQALHGKELFDEKIFPYRYGCKIKEVHDTYRIYGYSEIENKEWYKFDQLSEEEKQTVHSVWEQLGHAPEAMLIRMVRHETPFKDQEGKDGEPIDKAAIGHYFATHYLST